MTGEYEVKAAFQTQYDYLGCTEIEQIYATALNTYHEYFAWIRNVMDENKVNYQTAELGKVDQGGGGTIAYILGNENMDVVDAGIAVLNMHAPMEVISKADLYEAYLAYKAFLAA